MNINIDTLFAIMCLCLRVYACVHTWVLAGMLAYTQFHASVLAYVIA